MNRAVRRLTNQKMSQCFQQWCVVWETHKKQKVQMLRTYQRWNQRVLVRTFESLHTYAHERIRVRQLLFKVLGRIDNYFLFRGFSKWKNYIRTTMKTQLEKVSLISKMTQGLFNQTDVSDLVAVVMRQACDLLDADRATLFVVRTVHTKNKKNSTVQTYRRELYTFAAEARWTMG